MSYFLQFFWCLSPYFCGSYPVQDVSLLTRVACANFPFKKNKHAFISFLPCLALFITNLTRGSKTNVKLECGILKLTLLINNVLVFSVCKKRSFLNNRKCRTYKKSGSIHFCPSAPSPPFCAFTGQHCTEDVDECRLQPNTCQNGGTCTNKFGGYACVCVNGWSGPDCSENIDDCATAACSPGSTCIDRVASFICVCPHGKTGGPVVRSHMHMFMFTPNPEVNTSTSIDVCIFLL